MGFDGDGADDDGEKEVLCGGAGRFGASGVVLGGGLNGGEDLGGAGFEGGEFIFIPNGSGLLNMLR